MLGAHLSGASTFDGDVWAAALTVLLIVAAANIVNDVTDLSVDRLDRPQRPLASGRLKIRPALAAAALLATAGVSATFRLGVAATLTSVGFLIAGVAYSLVVRRVALLGHLWVAVVFGSTALWGGWTTGGTPAPVWAAAMLVTLFLLPRELLKSIGDVRGDTAAGWRTIAVVWGTEATMRALAATAGVFAVATALPVLAGIGGTLYMTTIWGGTVLPLIGVTAWVWPDVDQRLRRGEFLTALMWVPGLAALWQLG